MQGPTPVDERCAIAVSAGLLEMCLDLVVSHGAMNPKLTWSILQGVGAVAMARKSNKAIRKQEPTIRAKIEAVLRGGTINRPALETAQLIQAILQRAADCKSINSDRSSGAIMVTCRWCQLPMPENDCPQCSECERAFYCSQKCQVLDWKDGRHKQQCKYMKKGTAQTEQKCPSLREIRNAERLVENVKSQDFGQPIFFEIHTSNHGTSNFVGISNIGVCCRVRLLVHSSNHTRSSCQ